MPHLTKSFEIKARDYIRGGEVSIQIQGLLKTIGFDPGMIRRVSVCAYESEMNVVMHGGDGTVTMTVDTDRIVIDVVDNGAGIQDVELALQEGYSTASEEQREMGFGAGMGLPNIQKNADHLQIESEKGKGTHVTISFRVRNNGE
ncbi:MAG: ATP-binding protein [Desulfobacteraceae bacterium]|jgi:anti-sigma regulatory factor (Ser/Thr protein kinase)